MLACTSPLWTQSGSVVTGGLTSNEESQTQKQLVNNNNHNKNDHDVNIAVKRGNAATNPFVVTLPVLL